MYAIDVIPIARSAHKDTLTYLSDKKITLGKIIEVPLRKKVIPALVIECQSAKDIKTRIRKSSFQIRKIKSTAGSQILSKEFIRASTKTASEFALPIGQVIFQLVPKGVLKHHFKKPTLEKKVNRKTAPRSIIQDKESERFSHYKKLVRENFSKKKSIFITVPSRQIGEKLFDFVQKGIPEYVFLLHGSVSPKKLKDTWQEILDIDHPVLIIGTPMFLSIPRSDISRIVLEEESSSGYISPSTPRIDHRIFTEFLAKELGAELIFGDVFLRLKTINEIPPNSFRKLGTVQSVLFDMTEENTPLVFHEYPDKVIRLTRKQNENTFIFAGRKGLAPVTICRDCGHVVTASDGSAPMVLYEHPDGNYFYSPHTKEKRPADQKCSYCGGWRLQPLGLGIDTIKKELEKTVPDTKIFQIDSDKTPTHKKVLEVMQEFGNTPGSILLGTELAIPYLNEDIDNIIVTTIDSMLSLPDFEIQEKVLRTLIRLKSKSRKNFIVQTRNPDQSVFTYATTGNPRDFVNAELSSRKKFGFPPFKTLIKITLQGPEDIIKFHAEELVKYLAEPDTDIYPAHISKNRGSYIINILLRVDDWPKTSLSEKLKALPRQYRVQVHPENIL